MGLIISVFHECFKKKDIEKPILNIVDIYDDDNDNKLISISDLIENKKINWSNNQSYHDIISETIKLRKKYRKCRSGTV
jgi:hypothetical protein